jgi:O-methyltransferase
VKDAELVGVQKTLTPVLKAKALDNRLPDPILGDEYAELAMRRLDRDYDNRRFGTSQMGLAAVVRTKVHDDWARSFLADHSDAVVLHLGCGLDARVYRIDPPATVDWYDLDYPAVIELRQQFLPPREHYTQIGSSVTDLTWLERIPRPPVADGRRGPGPLPDRDRRPAAADQRRRRLSDRPDPPRWPTGTRGSNTSTRRRCTTRRC